MGGQRHEKTSNRSISNVTADHPLMNGCGKQSEQPDSAMESSGAETYEASSDVVDYEQDDDDFVYDGTFNEEVFEHICNDIKIDGTPLSMPGVFNELTRPPSSRQRKKQK